ncbi:BMP family ABC transporter substrate-binding protein [Kineosporia sp. J2-2]|uniref:BMP family ABC transporter substrate-binding protein n=1 Tax=Kineosporia corallincola TaxID=2835133 RepID=A0ABS5TBK6_9ACTN|nr:BMP family ABC transporter substrate-binding protein [Kineosporia corallincola]MBT0768462.1 BMP family ABC transporter substrate-binding protein [Kineosporia corallincola]
MNRAHRTLAAGAVVTALALTGCSGQKAATTTAQASGDGKTVALLYGTTGDHSIQDSAYAGFTQAQKDSSFTPLELSSPNTDDYQDRVDLALQQGADLAVGIGFQWTTPMTETDHPDTAFVAVDVDKGTTIEGATTVSFAAEESSYLVGMAAALASKSGHIGFVGGVNQPSIQNFLGGYEAGAKSVDPDITVDSTYLSPLGDFTGFSDPTKGKEAAATMYADGADVVYAAAGGSGEGVYEEAADSSSSSRQNWAIGVDGDVYEQVDAKIKPYILTSATKNIDVAVKDSISQYLAGDLKTGEQQFDLANGGVGYSTSGGFVDAYADQLDAAAKKIADGDIKVPSAL